MSNTPRRWPVWIVSSTVLIATFVGCGSTISSRSRWIAPEPAARTLNCGLRAADRTRTASSQAFRVEFVGGQQTRCQQALREDRSQRVPDAAQTAAHRRRLVAQRLAGRQSRGAPLEQPDTGAV